MRLERFHSIHWLQSKQKLCCGPFAVNSELGEQLAFVVDSLLLSGYQLRSSRQQVKQEREEAPYHVGSAAGGLEPVAAGIGELKVVIAGEFQVVLQVVRHHPWPPRPGRLGVWRRPESSNQKTKIQKNPNQEIAWLWKQSRGA